VSPNNFLIHYFQEPKGSSLKGDQIDSLIETLLNDEDYNERMEAAFDLGQLGDKRAIDPLLRALKDENVQVKKFAAISLGKFLDPRALEPLIDLSYDKSVQVRYGAVMGLAEYKNEKVSKRMIELLHDPDSDTDIQIAILNVLEEYKDNKLVSLLSSYWMKAKTGSLKAKVIDIFNSWYEILTDDQIEHVKQLLDQILDDRIRDLSSHRLIGYSYETGMEVTASEVAFSIISKNKKFVQEKHIKLIENLVDRDEVTSELAQELLDCLKE